MKKSFVYHWRGYIGEFKWSEMDSKYICEFENKTKREYIFTEGRNRLECLWNWIVSVNDMIEFKNEH